MLIAQVHEYKKDKRTNTELYRDTQHKLSASSDIVSIILTNKDGDKILAIQEMTPEEAIRYGSEIVSAAVSRLPYYRTR